MWCGRTRRAKQEDAAAQSVPNDGSFGQLVLLQSKSGIPAHPHDSASMPRRYIWADAKLAEGGSAPTHSQTAARNKRESAVGCTCGRGIARLSAFRSLRTWRGTSVDGSGGAGRAAGGRPAARPAWEWPRNPTNARLRLLRVHNFSSGPAQLPESVLERARDEFMSWPDAPGQSPMCISHRDAGGPYQQMQMRCEGQLRAMLDVPDNYSVVFMQGGAHGQSRRCR